MDKQAQDADVIAGKILAATPPAKPAATDLAAIEAREAKTLAWLEKTLSDPDRASLYTSAVGHDVESLENCGDAACRAAATAHRLARADFIDGVRGTIDDLPFTSSRYRPASGDLSGTLRVIPLDSGAALLFGDVGNGQATCSIEATVQVDEAGRVSVLSFEEGDPPLVLRTTGTGFELAYADPSTAGDTGGYCGIGATLAGPFAAVTTGG